MILARGIGLAIVTMDGETLDVWYPRPHLGTMAPGGGVDLLETLTVIQGQGDARQVRATAVTCKADLGDRPQSTADTCLRLHPLSHCLVKPNTINLDGIVSYLPNVVWTAQGPYVVEGFEETRFRPRAALDHSVVVLSVDKLPAMVHYVIPEGVHIADGAKVRLGAYLAEGTSVTHAAFVSYNVDTLGRCIVGGRISQGVVIDDGSDVGGDASAMGTLSSDGRNRVHLGERCLLGANLGPGTPLGDDRVVEAELFPTVGAKVAAMKVSGVVPGVHGLFAKLPRVPARILAGVSNVLFRRNSQSDRIETSSRGDKNIGIPGDASPHI